MELQGQPPEHRIPYRVLLLVHNVESAGEETAVDVEVGCWDHYHIVRLPLSLIPEHIRADIRCGTWLYADLRPPRHECAGVPVAHPTFPCSPSGKQGSWWG